MHPPSGPGGFGPPPHGAGGFNPGYQGAPPPVGPWGPPPTEALDKEALTWLIVGAAGWFVGFMWISGPLAWYFGAQLCEKYRAMGLQPSSNANAAKIVGIVTTILTVLIFAAVCAVIGLGFGAAVLGNRPR